MKTTIVLGVMLEVVLWLALLCVSFAMVVMMVSIVKDLIKFLLHPSNDG